VSKATSDTAATPGPHGTGRSGDSPAADARPAIAVVTDLFFVARIRETARLVGVPIVIARSADELAASASGARLVLVDLTGRFDFGAIFDALDRLDAAQRPPVLGYTTHAMARATQPWHARCGRVVTKETLTQELGVLLREGIPR
jgi:hypothetical protein